MSRWMKSIGVMVVFFSVLALVAPANTAQGAEEAAAFPTCYRIGTGLPGAPTLTVQWVVSTIHQTVSGVGTVTQAVNPPLNLHVNMHGHYMMDGDEVWVTAVGAKPGGAIMVRLILPDGWGKPGKADFRWYANNRFGDSGGNVPAAPCR
jgi:hypothetical protein